MTTFLPILFSTDDLGVNPDIVFGKNTLTELPVGFEEDETIDLAVQVRNIEFWNNGTTTFKGYSGPSRFTIDANGNTTTALNGSFGGNVNVVGSVNAGAGAFAAGVVAASVTAGLGTFTSVAAPFKLFDVEHQSRGGRLRHGCLEGPELAVYLRGRAYGGQHYIQFPEYWSWLVDHNTITVQLTPTMPDQHPYVSTIYSSGVEISTGGYGECHYLIMGERKDISKLQVETE